MVIEALGIYVQEKRKNKQQEKNTLVHLMNFVSLFVQTTAFTVCTFYYVHIQCKQVTEVDAAPTLSKPSSLVILILARFRSGRFEFVSFRVRLRSIGTHGQTTFLSSVTRYRVDGGKIVQLVDHAQYIDTVPLVDHDRSYTISKNVQDQSQWRQGSYVAIGCYCREERRAMSKCGQKMVVSRLSC